MSAWNVGNVGCPPKAKQIVPNAVAKDMRVTSRCTRGGADLASIPMLATKMTQAMLVAVIAPTAMGLHSKYTMLYSQEGKKIHLVSRVAMSIQERVFTDCKHYEHSTLNFTI